MPPRKAPKGKKDKKEKSKKEDDADAQEQEVPLRGSGVFFIPADGGAGEARYEGEWVEFAQPDDEEEKDAGDDEEEPVVTTGKIQDGQGTLVYANGEQYSGTWVQGCLSQGTYQMQDGSTYTGQFSKDGLFHGHGCIHFSNGDVYDGEWADHQFHGKGMLTLNSDNTVWSGRFQNGRFAGRTGHVIGLKLSHDQVAPTLRKALGLVEQKQS